MFCNSLRFSQIAVLGLCLMWTGVANAQHDHPRSAPRRSHSHPRGGVPTYSLGQSIMQTASWLNPFNVGHNGHYAHGHPHAPHHGRHVVRNRAGHVHGRLRQPVAEAHLEAVEEDELEIRMDVVEPASYQDAAESSIVQGEVIQGGVVKGGMVAGTGCLGGCDTCHPMGGKCDTCCLVPFPTFCWDNFEVGFGVQGFTGPTNRGETGSFGINGSFNWGVPMPLLTFKELGGQFGLRVAGSNFSAAEFTREERTQLFITTGFFHRVDWGFQGGLVVDYLRDDWYMKADITQVRGEISWVFPCIHEWGFWFAANTRNDVATSMVGQVGQTATLQEQFISTDVYAFFYRYRSDEIGGEARGFAGFTGNRDGLIGADMRIPIAPRWDIDLAYSYLIPDESSSLNGHVEESWNLAMNMVWYPGCRTSCESGYYRPLFDVADNGTFFVDRR